MPEWNELPTEMQEMIVQRCTENTRNAIKACSKDSKLLVEETKLQILNFLAIDTTDKYWTIDSTINEFKRSSQSFANFGELQQSLLELLGTINCIKRLYITIWKAEGLLKLKNDEKEARLLVESVEFVGQDDLQQENIVSQIEPIYLRKVTLHSHGGSSKFFDLHQVVCAEKISLHGESKMREEQLLKLQANDINIDFIDFSVQEYIRKCNLEAGTRLPRFRFKTFLVPDSELLDKVISKVPNSQLRFEVRYGKFGEVSGGVGYDSESCAWDFSRYGQSSFKTVEQLRITFEEEDNSNNNNSSWNIVIRRQFCCQNEYEFQEFGEFRKKLDEIMDNLDFIKYFSIQLTGSKKEMKWKRRNNKLMVKELFVEGDNDITSVEDLLEQIDPNFYLTGVTIKRNRNLIDNLVIHDMPQVRNASRVTISNPYIQDQDLLEVKNLHFCVEVYGDSDSEAPRSAFLTAAGINQFIKSCFRDVDTRPIYFNLGKLSKTLNTEEIFEGLDVTACEDYGFFIKYTINCNHPDPDYAINVNITFQEEVVISVAFKGSTFSF